MCIWTSGRTGVSFARPQLTAVQTSVEHYLSIVIEQDLLLVGIHKRGGKTKEGVEAWLCISFKYRLSYWQKYPSVMLRECRLVSVYVGRSYKFTCVTLCILQVEETTRCRVLL